MDKPACNTCTRPYVVGLGGDYPKIHCPKKGTLVKRHGHCDDYNPRNGYRDPLTNKNITLTNPISDIAPVFRLVR